MSQASLGAHPGALSTSSLQDALTLIGRVLLAILFVPSGFGKIADFSGTVGYIASKGLPLSGLGAVVAVVVELGLGLMLLFGWRTRWVALVLAIFTVAAGIFFHNYWAVPDAQVTMQKINFFKNIAIAGGLLAFAAFGPGRWSLDARAGRV